MALFRPDLFERQNVPGALISCGSERGMEGERVREGMRERRKGSFPLGGGGGNRNENCADPTSASVHLLARKECNGR